MDLLEALAPAEPANQDTYERDDFGQRWADVARGQYWIHPALAEVVENALLGLGTD